MFFSIRRKLHVLMATCVVLVLLFSVSTMHRRTSEILGTNIALDYIDDLGRKLFGNPIEAVEDPESLFYQTVEELYVQKTENGVSDSYWLLESSMTDTSVNIPNYYFEGKKPFLQPFDIRFTLGIYYSYLKGELKSKSNVAIPFHWDDWLDTSVLNKYILANPEEKPVCDFLDPEKKEDTKDKLMVANECCVNDLEVSASQEHGNTRLPGFNVFKHSEGKTDPEKAILFGKSYVYTYMPPPRSVLFLTHSGYYNVFTGSRSKLLDSGLVEKYISNTNSKSVDALEEFRLLRNTVNFNADEVLEAHEHIVPLEDFKFNHEAIIQELEDRLRSGDSLEQKELHYLESLKYSVDAVNNGGPPKYFGEAKLVGTTVGDHYDWRFFNGVQKATYKQTLTLHRLIRAWLSFTRKTGIVTWVAHGSLLSWYWNGMAFPWDDDIDVQVPVMDLHKLSLNFNQTLIVEDTEDGYGRFFLDCGTFISLRSKGNGNNNIDARFIDVDSGLYIDITGLAVSDSKAPERYTQSLPSNWNIEEKGDYETNLNLEIFNCRNNHFSSISEISPLVKSAIEGEIGYIPKRFTNMLSAEYKDKGMMSKKFSGHVFVSQLRLWINENDLLPFLKDREAWVDQYSVKKNERRDLISVEPFVAPDLSEEEKVELRETLINRGLVKRGINDKDMTTIMNFSDKDLLDLLLKDEIFIKFYRSYKFTEFHQEEMVKHWLGKTTLNHMSGFTASRPILYDPFAYNIHKSNISYDEEVSKCLDLQSEYLIPGIN